MNTGASERLRALWLQAQALGLWVLAGASCLFISGVKPVLSQRGVAGSLVTGVGVFRACVRANRQFFQAIGTAHYRCPTWPPRPLPSQTQGAEQTVGRTRPPATDEDSVL